MFPITVKHVREISYLNRQSPKNSLEYIEKELRKLKVENMTINDNKLEFKINFLSNSRNHPMAAVDKGYFQIDTYSSRLIYAYSTIRIFWIVAIMTFIMGSFAYVNSGFWYFGIIGFLWLYGMNWLITYVRHRMFLTRIIKGLHDPTNT